MKLDPIDIIILKELSQDGRASFREIAKKTSLSTPTVSSRFQRMERAGLFRKFAPVLNLEATDNPTVLALVTLSIPPSKVSKFAKDLARKSEVLGVYHTSGMGNLTIKVGFPSTRSLQHFISGGELRNTEIIGTQIITETIKDEDPLPIAEEFKMKLYCDFCKGEISTSRPYSVKVASTRYYFCCKTCRRSYLEKHGERIRAINSQRKPSAPLHL